MSQLIDHNFALKVRMYRIEKGLSLRALAAKIDQSKSLLSDIERGIAPATLNTAKKLQNVLQFKHQANVRGRKAFETIARQLHDRLALGDDEAAQTFAQALEHKLDFYTRGPFCIEYYMIMLMYALFTEKKQVVIEPYFKRLYAVRDFLDSTRKQYFHLLAGFYYLYKYELDAVEQTVKVLQKEMLAPLHEGFCLYVEAMAHVYDYRRFKSALIRFEKAKAHFISLNNFYFVMRIRVMEQRLYVYRQNFSRFWRLHEETSSYAQIHNHYFLKRDNLGNILRYHLIKGDYAALDALLESYDTRQQVDQFIHIYALYRLKRYKAAQALIETIEFNPIPNVLKPIQLGVETMAHLIATKPEKIDLERLTAFAETAYEMSNYLMIRISHKLLLEALQAKRHYKEALYYGERLLQIMWAMTGGVR